MVTIQPGALERFELPYVSELAQLPHPNARGQLIDQPGTSVVRPGGAYHLTTTAPVTAYQFNPVTFQSGSNYSYSNDASLLLPTSVLGTQYTVLTWPGLTFQIGAAPAWESGGTITVVGTGTGPVQVSVTLAGAVVAGTGVTAAAPGAVQTYSLSPGDVLQLIGRGQGSDLTGSSVHASGPVAVYAGHGCAQVPADRAAGNHLEEQLFPDSAWGKRYAVSAFIDRPMIPSVVRIIARDDATRLTFDPPAVHPSGNTLGAHQVLQFETTSHFVVTSDKPVLVAQFMYGGGLQGGDGDPAMVYEVPTEQYRTQYTFLAPDTFSHSYINVVSASSRPPMLDQAPITAPAQPIGSSGLSAWTLEIQPGVHQITSVSSEEAFGIKVYGTAPFTGYAYPGGLDLQIIAPG
jgi:hypothetical protein